MIGDGSESACLDLDESEKNAPFGGQRIVAVAGIAYRRRDIRLIEEEIRVLKGSLGLDPEDELKYNFGAGHPSRVKMERKGLSRREWVTRSLTAIGQWPIHVVGHVALSSDPSSQTRIDDYLGGIRASVLTFAGCVAPERGTSGHQVRIDNPGSEMGRKPFSEYQSMYHRGLERVGFAPDLQSTHAVASGFLQVADLVVGCLAEYVAEQARVVARGSAYRPSGWPADNFRLIVRRAFLPEGGVGVSVSAPSQDLANALEHRMILDGLLADDPNDVPAPVRVFARPKDPRVTHTLELERLTQSA